MSEPTQEMLLREGIRNILGDCAWRVLNGERLDRSVDVFEQYALVLDEFADAAIKVIKYHGYRRTPEPSGEVKS